MTSPRKNTPIKAKTKSKESKTKAITKRQTTSTKKPAKRKPSGAKSTKGRGKRKITTKQRLGRLVFTAMVLLCILVCLFFTTVYLGFWGHVPSYRQLESIKNPSASEVYAADGRLLGRYYIENRSQVDFQEISPNVIHALVATEDARFYEHNGIDRIALMRVFFKTLLLGQQTGGGSTLSQQAAKNIYPRSSSKWLMPANKLREAITAYRLEKIYSKEEILALYLNTVPFGENIYGIGLASERFFSKTPAQLSVDEAAVLIGMLKANNAYNPRKNPERSKERRNVVIAQMHKEGYLTAEEEKFYQEKELKLSYKVISYNTGPAPYFLAMLLPQLKQWCEDNIKPNGEAYNIYTDGLQIKTTINYDFQQYAEEAVKAQLKSLQKTFDAHWSSSKPWDKDWDIFHRAVQQSSRYKLLKKSQANEEEIKKAFRTAVEMSVFTPEGTKDIFLSPNDSIKRQLMQLHAGFLALNPQSGALQAWVGGIDFQHFQYDHNRAKRQVGSTFKPLVYLAGLEEGLSIDAYFSNERKVYKAYQNWSPRNSHPDYSGYYSMRGALSKSINTIAVEVAMQTGLDELIDLARSLGISADLPEYPSLALGVASVSLEEMVAAYAAIINDGKYTKPYYLVSIEDAQGRVLAEFAPPRASDVGINPDHSRAVVQMMQSVIDEGSGSAMRHTWGVTGDLAGKTGTTQNGSDGWFIAASPHLVAGCWVGADNPAIHFRTIKYGQGAYLALPVVGRFYQRVYANSKYKGLAQKQFKLPSAETRRKLQQAPYVDLLPREEQGGFFLRHKNKASNQLQEREERPAEKKLSWKERRAKRRAEREARRKN